MPTVLRRTTIAILALPILALAAPVHSDDAMSAPMPKAPASPGAVMAPEVIEAPWQDVISSQIQAFRDHDAPVAFSFAGAGFQTTFPTPEDFFIAIIKGGYAPIMESKSHSFGAFKMVGEVGVVQEVRFTGHDQSIYGAMYQLTREEGGWRVQGVQMFKEAGIAI